MGTSARVGELPDGGQPLPVEPPLSRRLCGRFVLVDHLDVALAQQPLHGEAPDQPQEADANAHLGGPADGSELHGYAQLFPLILVVWSEEKIIARLEHASNKFFATERRSPAKLHLYWSPAGLVWLSVVGLNHRCVRLK